jgi:hypothetical protein
MAQKTIVTLVDDLTGEEAEDITTVEFALDGVTYEIDLDEKNSERLRDALAEYIAAARRTGGRRASAGRRRASGGAGSGTPRATSPGGYDRETSKQIREWAKAQGFEVSDRGRVPNNVVEAWEAQRKGSDRSATFSG